MSYGIDYSFARPDAAWIAANFSFVIRYLCWHYPASDQKIIGKDEFADLEARGLRVLLNWENNANDMLGGRQKGYSDAAEALWQAKALGAFPCRVYFSNDFDSSAMDQTLINEYLAAAGEVIGKENVGIYGGYWPVRRAMEAGVAAHGWQTYAWSRATDAAGNPYTLWYEGAKLKQVQTLSDYDLVIGDIGMATLDDVMVKLNDIQSKQHDESVVEGWILAAADRIKWNVQSGGMPGEPPSWLTDHIGRLEAASVDLKASVAAIKLGGSVDVNALASAIIKLAGGKLSA